MRQGMVRWIAAGLLSALMLQTAMGTEIDIATAYGTDVFHTQNIQQFADEVRRLTAGQVNFKVHPGGVLLKPTEIFTGVTSGRVGAGEVIMSSLSKENVMFGIDSIPFIVSGYDDARRMWETSRPAVERLLNQYGLQLLFAVPWPAQNLYARREINTMKDFKGLSMRSYSPATERIAELIGAKPVTIQAVELSKAIADERLDLMITSSATGVDTKAWTTLKHYYKVTAWIPKNIVFINQQVFASLDKDERKKITDAARAAEERGWRLSRESDMKAENLLAANNINVSTIDFIIRSYLDRLGETLARDWLKKAGNEELRVLLKYTTERSTR